MLSVDGCIHESGDVEILLVGGLYHIDVAVDFPARTTVLHLLDDFVSCIRRIGVAYGQDSLQVVLYYGADIIEAVDAFAEYAAHAINSHDELVAEVERLRESNKRMAKAIWSKL